MSQLATEPDDSRRGVDNIKYLPAEKQITRARRISMQAANSIDIKGTLEGAASLGHPDHIERIREQQNVFFQHYVATKNKLRMEFSTAVNQGRRLLMQ